MKGNEDDGEHSGKPFEADSTVWLAKYVGAADEALSACQAGTSLAPSNSDTRYGCEKVVDGVDFQFRKANGVGLSS